MSYIINNSRGQIVAVVGDGTVNTTATDVALIGRAVTNYGEYQNENYVYLLENFANGSAPLQPILGQLWYNSTTDIINAYSTANTWVALATQNYVEAAKISPAFTGVPTAPTASSSTNTTQLSTTAFVQNNKISPAFTGVPTAPTASDLTNTTQLATTAFVQNQLSSASGFSSAGTISAAGFLTTGSVSATGNVLGGNIATGGNVVALGQISTTGNLTGGNINTAGAVSATGNVIGANFIGNVIPPAGGAVSTTGNVTGGNILTSGLISASGNLLSDGLALVTGNITGGNINTAGQISAAGNIIGANLIGTVIGNLTGTTVSVSGNITGNNLSVGNGTVTLNNIVNNGGNATGNIGSSTNYFNQVFATATTALYADLAEYYRADAEYSPGTVLVFGGNNEVTLCRVANDTRVAGVVTTEPAYVMNAKLSGEFTVAVALQGRVPVQVLGPVSKGDLMVTGINGHAQANNQARAGTILGKSLENFDGETGIIEIAVGRS
jgi:hypothetical protein